jgi:hypothetical protein
MMEWWRSQLHSYASCDNNPFLTVHFAPKSEHREYVWKHDDYDYASQGGTQYALRANEVSTVQVKRRGANLGMRPSVSVSSVSKAYAVLGLSSEGFCK